MTFHHIYFILSIILLHIMRYINNTIHMDTIALKIKYEFPAFD